MRRLEELRKVRGGIGQPASGERVRAEEVTELVLRNGTGQAMNKSVGCRQNRAESPAE